MKLQKALTTSLVLAAFSGAALARVRSDARPASLLRASHTSLPRESLRPLHTSPISTNSVWFSKA